MAKAALVQQAALARWDACVADHAPAEALQATASAVLWQRAVRFSVAVRGKRQLGPTVFAAAMSRQLVAERLHSAGQHPAEH